MKKILIISSGKLSQHFLQRILNEKSVKYQITLISQDNFNKQNNDKFIFYNFDPTAYYRLNHIADEYFNQFMIINDDENEALVIYDNLRKISPKTEIIFVDFWNMKEKLENDKHLILVDSLSILSSRLIDFMPDRPTIADSIGLGLGEIMELKIPVGSSYMYRHIKSIQQRKWKIALIYRDDEIMLPVSNLMLLPNDRLLIVGDPNVLTNVFRSINTKQGQFPEPFGSNLYCILDMKKMNKRRIRRLMKDSMFLHSKLNTKKLYFKVLNPTLGKNLEILKRIKDKNVVVLFEYFISDNSHLQGDVPNLDIGCLITDTIYFEKNKRLFHELQIPVFKIGNLSLSKIKRGVVLGGDSQIESQSALIVDCCSGLKLDMKFYYFDGKNNEQDDLIEHFKSIKELFAFNIDIENKAHSNPLIDLSPDKDLLHFVLFDKKVAGRDLLSVFSRNMGRLYSKLSHNAQLFIPINS